MTLDLYSMPGTTSPTLSLLLNLEHLPPLPFMWKNTGLFMLKAWTELNSFGWHGPLSRFWRESQVNVVAVGYGVWEMGRPHAKPACFGEIILASRDEIGWQKEWTQIVVRTLLRNPNQEGCNSHLARPVMDIKNMWAGRINE